MKGSVAEVFGQKIRLLPQHVPQEHLTSVTSIGAFGSYSNMPKVFYKGGKEQWYKIYAGDINDKLYFYSEAAPTGSGKYWHYAKDGVTPVIW